jgi:hypothetical protein
MDCPCKSLEVLDDPELAQKILDKWLEKDPDGDWEIWDVYCFEEMGMCPDCPYMTNATYDR